MKNVLNWLLQRVKDLLAWLWSIVRALATKFIAASLEKKVLSIIGTVIGIYLAADQVNHVVGPAQTKDYREEVAHLGEGVQRSLTEGFREMKDFAESVKKKLDESGLERESFLRKIDSLEKQNKKLVMLSTGEGSIQLTGGGEVKSGHFADNWLKADYSANSMQYDFQFTLHDITAEFTSQDNKRTEIYKVFLRSLVDPNDIRHIGDYKRERSLLIQDLADTRSWYWNDLAINGDFVYNGQSLEGALSLSLCTLTAGGLSADQVIGRLPEVGASSNLRDSHHLFVGIRVNVAHYLALFRDLYLAPKYAIDIRGRTGFLVGIGTTL